MPSQHFLLEAPLYYRFSFIHSSEKHFHSHAELILVNSGSVTLHTEKEHTLEAGDACLIFPNQSHGFYSERGAEVYMLNFSGEHCPEYSELFVKRKPLSNAIRGLAYVNHYAEIFDAAYKTFSRKEAYYEQLCRAYTLLLCSEALKRMTLVAPDSSDLRTIQLVTLFCRNNYTQKLTLETLSAKLHISRHYISHLFSAELNVSFTDYINSLRISSAKALLETTDRKITDISLSSGFENQRTFNRVFLKSTGLSPREYRSSFLRRVQRLTHGKQHEKRN